MRSENVAAKSAGDTEDPVRFQLRLLLECSLLFDLFLMINAVLHSRNKQQLQEIILKPLDQK